MQVSMTTLVSDKVHLFTGWRDIPKGKPGAFHFLKKNAYSFLGEAKKGQNLTKKWIESFLFIFYISI